ncbi:hypothetical protein FS842_008757 [Serendipita sp. 407]|nr:hypothetical protein FS842_008757 [Serendipita sp. 407]
MAIPSKDLFPPPPPTADSTTQGTTGSAEPLRLVIFRNPIHHATSLFSRGTRCYLAINRDFIDSHKPSKDKPTNETVIQAMRMVKTAWQYDARHHEGDFFRLYRERNKGTIPCGVPTLLASGRGVSQQAIKVDYGTPEEKEEERVPTEEVGEIEPYHGLDHLVANLNEILHYPPTVTPYSNKEVSTQGASGDRTFHWLLFKEVGAKLENARGSKEFLRVLMDVLDAHKSFYDARILHRDISGNNILIKLSTEPGPRRGLLIDWDMAKDLDETRLHQRPMMTGTLPYMSVALKHNPRHQYWHDIESLFWVWVFYSVRHMEGISLDGSLMRNREARATKLDKYFPASGLERLCQAKRSFLSIGSLDVANCPFYQDACDLVQMSFMKLYRVLEDICRLVNAIESYRKARGLSLVSETKPETSPGPYGIITTSDIFKILEPLENLAEKDSRLLSKFRSIQTSLKGLVIPDHSSVHDELNKAYEVNEDAQWLPFDPPDKGHNLIDRLKEVSQSESQRATPNPLPTSSRRGDDSIADQTSGQESREYLYKDPKPGKRKHGDRTETLKGTSSGSNKRQKRAK